ncbi:nematode cuticle collagen domain protein [Ancylostoma duodenale]|uniref:Nematode cuticle collagen domain protein n=1 Tax=Ancylostoma duodenale TaxID=51022 RepID=A0A0C2CZW4_9BILA|nr:nematode cuticle collagen domain protein [Ancylostoma duodenale]
MQSQISSMWSELDAEIEEFKALTNDSWETMLTLGVGTPSNRQRRQYGGYGASGRNTQSSSSEESEETSSRNLLIPKMMISF